MANLVVGGGAPVRGELGSYVWGGAGSDSPWLVPPADEAVRVSGPYLISVIPPLPVERWRSAWAKVEDGTVGGPEGPASEGTGPITIREPGLPGTWSLQVTVRFTNGNHATWYWRAEVAP